MSKPSNAVIVAALITALGYVTVPIIQSWSSSSKDPPKPPVEKSHFVAPPPERSALIPDSRKPPIFVRLTPLTADLKHPDRSPISNKALEDLQLARQRYRVGRYAASYRAFHRAYEGLPNPARRALDDNLIRSAARSYHKTNYPTAARQISDALALFRGLP